MRAFIKIGHVPILSVLLVLGLFFTAACSEKSSAPADDPDAETVAESSVDRDPAAESATEEDDYEEAEEPSVVDEGEACGHHAYRMNPGAVETLTFEKLLRKKPEEEDIQLEMTRDALSERGVDISIVGVEIETYTTTYGVWAVDLGASEAYRRSLEKGGHLTGLSTEGRGLKGVTGVKHVRDAYFVVSAIDGRAWSQQAISDLSEDELYDMLDGDLAFRHTDPMSKRADSFPLERIDVEKEFYIARLTVSVSVSTADFLPDSINGEENWYRSGPVGFDLGCSYRADRKSPKVTINGPAYEPDCYRPW